MKNRKPSTHIQTLKIYWHFTRKNPALFWYGTIGSALAVIVSDVLPPFIIANALNHLQHLYSANQAITFSEMQPYFIAYTVCVLSGWVLWRTEAFAAWRYMILTEQRLMDHVFNHLQYMDNKFHSNRFGGALVSQTNKFISAYERLTADFTWSIVTGITVFVTSLTVLAFTNWPFAAVFACVAVIYCALIYWRMKLQMPYNRQLSTSESETTAKLADTITNIATVRSFAGESTETKLFHRQTEKTKNAGMDLMRVQLTNEVISQGSTTFLKILAFAIGIMSITWFNAPVGSLYLTLTYTLNLSERLWQFMFILRNINRAFGDAADMTETLQLQSEIKDPDNPKPARITKGSIELKDVSFRYGTNQDESLFAGLNMSIKPGEHVGLVGHSGGGKSSLVRLISRVMDIDSGQILIDGQDINEIRQRDLRSNIAYVPQEPLLFHRSLMENIRYGRPDASDEEVIKFAKLAHAHEFIQSLSEGYETLVGERGIKLSGGQRQRVAIARAMLTDAPILILDEATSALDSESEVLIQDALWKLMEGRTAIVIAHRLSTIQKMDRIIVLENGSITEQGSHKKLLAKNGTYAKLWTHQSGGFIDDNED